MKKVVLKTLGNIVDSVEVVPLEREVLKPNEVRIQLRYSPLHNHDLHQLEGTYGVKPNKGDVVGSEAVGTIIEVGSDITHLIEGQRVIVAGGKNGVWADEFIKAGNGVIPIPDEIPDSIAAQLIAMPLSTLLLLEVLNAKPGDWVIYNAAAGAVGRLLASIAGERGINLIGVVHRAPLIDVVKSYGVEYVVSTDQADWKETVRSMIKDAPIDFAIDSVGGIAAQGLMDLLARRGKLVSFGSMSGESMVLNHSELLFKVLTVRGFWAAPMMQEMSPAVFMEKIHEIIGYAKAGKLQLPVAAVYGVNEIKDALTAATTGSLSTGKILVKGSMASVI